MTDNKLPAWIGTTCRAVEVARYSMCAGHVQLAYLYSGIKMSAPGSGVGRFLVRTVRKDHVIRTHLNSCFERRLAICLPHISEET